jgi:hypothetical protein
MSYLDPVRLVFYGDFQADVSTVNNDVRHYDDATFEPRFQQLTHAPDQNGWWRPTGSNAFRLINCRVESVHHDGPEQPGNDPAVGALIGGSAERVSGKLVDLDPQWQMSSQIWGLQVSLTNAAGEALFHGHFEPTGFRDILFGRQVGARNVNGQSAGAVFQSVLTNVTWSERHTASPALRALHKLSLRGTLSIRLTTFGYYTLADKERFTLGTVCGVIGPAFEREPRTFITGRRFAPANGDRSASGVSFFDGLIGERGDRVWADLSNAIPLTDPVGAQKDIGSLELAVLNDEAIAEGAAVTAAQAISLGEIPYREKDWLRNTSGIFSAALPQAASEAAKSKPWAILGRAAAGQPATVVIRETTQGWNVRAEQFVQRLDPGDTGNVDLYVTQFGARAENAPISVALVPPQSDVGGGPDEPHPPKAPIPVIIQPADALSFDKSISTKHGQTTLKIHTKDPKNPRVYLDGQIYWIQYTLTNVPDLVQYSFDLVIVHLRNAYPKPHQPTWLQDIAPLLTQYGNLYPVMNERIVDLTDYESVKGARAILSLAFSLAISDPNHMPVTRDLSAAKRDTILHWLNEKDAQGNYILRHGTPKAAAAAKAQPRAIPEARQALPSAAAANLAGDDVGGKTDFLRTLPTSLIKRK